MGHGLIEFKENDHAFKKAYLYRLGFSGLFVGSWYQFAKTARLFDSSKVLTKSLPIAFLIGYFYSKGIAQHISAAEAAGEHAQEERKDRYLDYRNELRHKKIID